MLHECWNLHATLGEAMIDVDEATRIVAALIEDGCTKDGAHDPDPCPRCTTLRAAIRTLRSAAFEAAATEMTRIAVERGHTNSTSVRLFVEWCKRGGRSLAAKETP